MREATNEELVKRCEELEMKNQRLQEALEKCREQRDLYIGRLSEPLSGPGRKQMKINSNTEIERILNGE